MSTSALTLLTVFSALLLALGLPLGLLIARVFRDRSGSGLTRPELWLLAAAGCDPTREMGWEEYARAAVAFGFLGVTLTFAIQRLQSVLPLNPAGLDGVNPGVAFNTAVSFATNTNWQAYSAETTMSPLTQMAALTTQNFVSAATGLAVLNGLIRGLARREARTIGNFWVDLYRSVVRILLPLSLTLAVALVATGVPQTFDGPVAVALLDAGRAVGTPPGTQTLVRGPVASQVAIKQLGTNGGGYFNANSAHPFENPTPLSNLIELVAILLIPTALCFTFGELVRDRRQGWALLAAMFVLFIPAALATMSAERAGTPLLAQGSLEGKEVRFGLESSALWAAATTAASNGSVNAMHDSLTPLGGLAPLVLMQSGEVVFGGVGSGLYGMVVYVIVAVFLAGLMVGRTPEYLGKRIEAFEMKMAALALLLPSAAVLLGTALACVRPGGYAPATNPGPHGFSEILYAFSSGANNNGSAFAGLDGSGVFYVVAIAVTMLVGRFGVIVPVLALAGSLAVKRPQAKSAATLTTHSPLFVFFLVATVVLLAALTFLPALALGPIVEQFSMEWN